jgi:hypothetical protein
MRGALLTRKPDTPQLKRVRFDAPAALVEETTALIATARRHGFELSLNEALADAYARIAAKLRAELDAALGEKGDAAAPPAATEEASPDHSGGSIGDARDDG